MIFWIGLLHCPVYISATEVVYIKLLFFFGLLLFSVPRKGLHCHGLYVPVCELLICLKKVTNLLGVSLFPI